MGHATKPPSDGAGAIEPIALKGALEERYLAYALSTIMHRALPDARDGLKPVHRRLLHAMRALRLDPGQAYKKCARIVGDVIGKLHPHGDQAVYDALVRLAQDFAQRYPLIDGQGNFGNIDGDGPAAYRYTEARLTEVARLILEGLDEDAVDFRDTYNGEDREPVVLPGAFPNLLANGSQGIAVGMATSIPPHNAAEICDAALHLIAHPDADAEALMAYVRGPDFPTGGIVIDPGSDMLEAYRTGRGTFRTRARWATEDLGRGMWQAVVTEIPYLVRKGTLIERMAELLEAKKLPLVADVRDESSDTVRIVIEPRSRTVDPAVLMESLFRVTDLETRFPLNLNVLVDGATPRVIGLPEALKLWIDHRREVAIRRARFALEKIERRLEIVRGLLIVFLDLDEVIRIIREEDDAKAGLIARFALTPVQADAILDTRLRALRRLEEMQLRTEADALEKQKLAKEQLLGSDKRQWRAVEAEIREVRKLFGPDTALGKRRTDLAEAVPLDINLDDALIEREPVTVVLSLKGWLRAPRSHLETLDGLQFKGDDGLRVAIKTDTAAKLLALSSDGRVYTIDANKLPGGRGFGEPVRVFADVEERTEIVALVVHKPGARFLVVGSDGYGFVVRSDDLLANTRKGRQVLNLAEGATARALVPGEGDHVATIGTNRRMLVFPIADVPAMGRGRGVRLQRFRDGKLSDARVFTLASGLLWRDASGGDRKVDTARLQEWLGSRGDAGRAPPRGFPPGNVFDGA